MSGFSLRFLGHSTVRLELGGRVVLTDPVLTARVGGLVRVVPVPSPGSYAGVDLVLLSHLHGDHVHPPSLRLLGPDTRIVVPRGAGTWLRRKGFERVEEIAPGETLTDGGLTVTATEAVHSGHRWGPRLTHGPQSPALGHLIEGDGKKIYHAGDTDLFDGMREFGPVDIALLPVWGWGPNLGPGHLDPARAAVAAGLVQARAAVPVHWGTLALPGVRRTARMRRLLADPPRVFAAEVKAGGGTTDVLFTEPGADVALPAPKDRT
ncbi:MBL fold metallo-hydrolase [Amycolatopsis rifamycinica]|uniref:Zn-dependent hydrolase n=1 Tax=Amycolatopsis rifamycinica TaxID=287986 RepID=A0A066TZU5_9PSEU|nr:MBL fold metallo-hydrolase [Amycolatopsis rifamycinica]KDN17518.1 Zn-dependent hydrolase [Amycolatopsis rifamycinica]